MRHVPNQLAHIVYRTHRFEEMLDWYREVFAARVAYQNPALAFLTFDEEHHRFAIANLDTIRPDTKDPDDRGLVGVDHVAWDFASMRDILENYTDLKAKGIIPYWAVNHGMSASLYYADPDGNQMEFTTDCFGTKKEGNAYWDSPEIGSNPVGVEFDPEDWIARLEAGTPEEDLLKIDMALPVSPIRGAMLEGAKVETA